MVKVFFSFNNTYSFFHIDKEWFLINFKTIKTIVLVSEMSQRAVGVKNIFPRFEAPLHVPLPSLFYIFQDVFNFFIIFFCIYITNVYFCINYEIHSLHLKPCNKQVAWNPLL